MKKLKELDHLLCTEIKDEGVMGFEKFKTVVQKMAEDESGISQLYSSSKSGLGSVQGS